MLIIAFSLEIINFELHNLIIVLAYHLLKEDQIKYQNTHFIKLQRNLWKIFDKI